VPILKNNFHGGLSFSSSHHFNMTFAVQQEIFMISQNAAAANTKHYGVTAAKGSTSTITVTVQPTGTTISVGTPNNYILNDTGTIFTDTFTNTGSGSVTINGLGGDTMTTTTLGASTVNESGTGGNTVTINENGSNSKTIVSDTGTGGGDTIMVTNQGTGTNAVTTSSGIASLSNHITVSGSGANNITAGSGANIISVMGNGTNTVVVNDGIVGGANTISIAGTGTNNITVNDGASGTAGGANTITAQAGVNTITIKDAHLTDVATFNLSGAGKNVVVEAVAHTGIDTITFQTGTANGGSTSNLTVVTNAHAGDIFNLGYTNAGVSVQVLTSATLAAFVKAANAGPAGYYEETFGSGSQAQSYFYQNTGTTAHNELVQLVGAHTLGAVTGGQVILNT
jgi:hypothetical protein